MNKTTGELVPPRGALRSQVSVLCAYNSNSTRCQPSLVGLWQSPYQETVDGDAPQLGHGEHSGDASDADDESQFNFSFSF